MEKWIFKDDLDWNVKWPMKAIQKILVEFPADSSVWCCILLNIYVLICWNSLTITNYCAHSFYIQYHPHQVSQKCTLNGIWVFISHLKICYKGGHSCSLVRDIFKIEIKLNLDMLAKILVFSGYFLFPDKSVLNLMISSFQDVS